MRRAARINRRVQDMNQEILAPSFDLTWVAISFVVSVIDTYTTLWVAPSVAGKRNEQVN